MKYILALIVLLSLSTAARADTLTLFTERVAVGQPYGMSLCEISCTQTPYVGPDILEQVSFVDTGVPSAEFFTASDPNVSKLVDYLMSPDPFYAVFIRTIASSNLWDGHFDFYPIPEDSVVTGMLFEIDGSGEASYSVTGTNLVPEPGTMLLSLLGIMGVLAVARIYRTTGYNAVLT